MILGEIENPTPVTVLAGEHEGKTGNATGTLFGHCGTEYVDVWLNVCDTNVLLKRTEIERNADA